mgnify:CR=1 FL=1
MITSVSGVVKERLHVKALACARDPVSCLNFSMCFKWLFISAVLDLGLGWFLCSEEVRDNFI